MHSSYNTKKLLGQAFKDLTNIKSFKDIAIKDITTACGMSRHAFYYHFKDKQELVSWIYSDDIFSTNLTTLTDRVWSKYSYLAVDVMFKNKTFYTEAAKMQGQNSFSEYLHNGLLRMFYNVIERTVGKAIDAKNQEFIASFYAHAFAGVFVEWTLNGMKETPEELLDYYIDVTEPGFLQTIRLCSDKYLEKHKS